MKMNKIYNSNENFQNIKVLKKKLLNLTKPLDNNSYSISSKLVPEKKSQSKAQVPVSKVLTHSNVGINKGVT